MIDLLNGTGNYIVWSGKTLPTNSCLGGSFASFAEGESGDHDDNGFFAEWFVAYIVNADPADAEEQYEFEVIVDNLTGWILEHFSAKELGELADELSDPGLTFASDAGEKAAAEVVSAITQ